MTVTVVKPRQVTVRSPIRHVITVGQQGPQGPAGPAGSALTPANWSVSGTLSARTINYVRANDVTLTTPASPSFGDVVQFVVPQAYTGFVIDGNGNTVDGQASIALPVTPCSLTLSYDSTESNWFIFSMNTGQNAA